jgi:hypothetical protein
VALVRWDDESGPGLVLALAGIALFGFGSVTTGPESYLRVVVIAGLVLSILSVPLAVVPALRATSGTSLRRALVTLGFWLVVATTLIVVGTATR